MDDDNYLRVLQVLDSIDRDERPRLWTRIASLVNRTANTKPQNGKRNRQGAVGEARLHHDSVAANPAAASLDVSQTRSDPQISSVARASKVRHLRRFSSVALVLAVGIGAVFAARHYSILARATRLFGERTPTQFELRVEQHRDGTLLVRWDPNSVNGAKAGMLKIEDGSERQSVSLDSSQLANGSLMYSPATRDLTFRLDVVAENGQQKLGFMRIVNGSVAPPRADATKLAKSAPGAKALRNQSSRHTAPEAILAGATAPVPASRSMVGPPVANIPKSSRELPRQAENLTETLAAKTSDVSRAPNDSAENLSHPISEPTYVPARPLHQVAPSQPNLGSLGLSQPVEIAVKVRIDQEGRVVEAEIVNNSSNDENVLASAALVAAKQWTFAPAKVRGRTVPSDHTIVFHFRPQLQP